MTTRSRVSLERVLDALGETLLTVVHGTADSAVHIESVVIHDPVDDLFLPSGALVLGVGMTDADAIGELLHELGRRGAAGLILRSSVSAGEPIERMAAQTGVAVLGLTRGASWDQLAAMLRSILAEGDLGLAGQESLGGVPSGDLFALANAISALVDAPITIEDRDSRVLAFSGGQDEADAARVETVLGRQVPGRYAKALTERGVFRELYHSNAPVHIGPVETEDSESSWPRVAVAVRAGDEILGSIWAVTPRPMTPERLQALQDAGKVVALQLLRVRAGADVEHRLRADLVGTALEGGAGAREALYRLGLADQSLLVMALAPTDADSASATETASLAGETQRLANAFAMHLGAVFPRASSALVGRVLYALLPADGSDVAVGQSAVRIAEDFLDRLGDRVHVLVGIGSVAGDVSELAYARACADRALRVLRETATTDRIAALADVQSDALLLELRDLMAVRGDRPTGPIARLVDHEGGSSGTLVQTVHAWLDAFGDVATAAAALEVHPNTFRYRLRRAAEVSGLDLNSSNARFIAMLQLRLLLPESRRSAE